MNIFSCIVNFLSFSLSFGFDVVYPLRSDSFGPFVYVGSHADAMNTDSLRLLRIKHILLVGKREINLKTLDYQHDHTKYDYLEVEGALDRDHYEKALTWLTKAYDKTLTTLSPGGKIPTENVMIVSARGCQRSGAIATAFLRRYDKMDASTAAQQVSKRRQCFVSQPSIVETINKIDEVIYVPTTVEEIADDLLKDVGRAVNHRALNQIDLGFCEPMHDVFWYYGDIPSHTGSTFFPSNSTMHCCELCDRHPECLYWSFGLAGEHKERCFLRNGDGSYMENRAHFISGKRGGRVAKMTPKELEKQYGTPDREL